MKYCFLENNIVVQMPNLFGQFGVLKNLHIFLVRNNFFYHKNSFRSSVPKFGSAEPLFFKTH